MARLFLFLFFFLYQTTSFASYILIPMDHDNQKNHLKAYGITYWALAQNIKVQWLLNFEGGSFLLADAPHIRKECQIRGVSYQVLTDAEQQQLIQEIAAPSQNQEVVLLEKAPKIAVYTPSGKMPWDDAVTLVLTYAEIPFTPVYDTEVLRNDLVLYDWLHLHHEDFTGQYGKFFGAYRSAPWYIEQKKQAEELAQSLGYNKVSDAKLAVAHKIRDFVIGGGFMFAMCSATDSFDIALSAEGVDICEPMFDGDATSPNYQAQIDYAKTFAFKDFVLERSPTRYEFSDIDMTEQRRILPDVDYFTLMEYSAKWDPIPTMLCQNHTQLVKGFMGQTTAFNPELVKANVLVMGKNMQNNEARYIHGTKGKGMFTFFGGHDPEDYQHRVGDAPTLLDLHPNSPGYRLILNNILFPAARKKPQKT
ncbi:asparagine synthetase B [Flavobacterium agricola]|uniref:Asparagine synthetase B n=1 Tax=Flavobacterium agricola TaxID=2870839 RepID=A0ABY6M009_9FLAO|nr:asparagine synthetase B [Flavobacterium agricola]UYW00456.1 asparagine synthetase B [Flavobacterium agricola]